jgi:hypothetical protein
MWVNKKCVKEYKERNKTKKIKAMALPMFSHSSELWSQKQEAETTQRKVLTYAVECKLNKCRSDIHATSMNIHKHGLRKTKITQERKKSYALKPTYFNVNDEMCNSTEIF